MKRTLFLFAASLAILASCSKPDNPQKDNPQEKKEDDPVIKITGITTITAPTFSDGTSYQWSVGERVLVFKNETNATVNTITALEEKNVSQFDGTVSKTMADFRAFCPKDKFVQVINGTNFRIAWPQEQKGVPGAVATGMLPMVCNSSSTLGNGFKMTPLAGLLKFTIAGSDITKVVLSVGSSNADYLAADVLDVNSSTGNTSTQSSSQIYRTLTLTPLSGTTFQSGDYYFSLISKSSARSISGYSLTYYKSDGSTIVREFNNVLSITAGNVVAVEGSEDSVAQNSTSVSGTVTNASTGAGIPGVLVSDGLQIVKTNQAGKYSFTSDLKSAQNVFVIMPAEYEFTANEWGGWSNYANISTEKTHQTINFSLKPRSSNSDKYRILLLGDPQQMSSRAHSGESWTYVTNAIKEYKSTVSVPLYQISLGDMVTNEIEVPGMAEAYLAKQKVCGVTTFSTPGNHDHVQKATTYYASVYEFSKWFGPYNFSFNLGKQHFIFLDSCDWSNAEYKEGLSEQGINYLEADLSYVDKSTPVHIFTHCPLTKRHNAGFPSTNRFNSRMIKALAGRHVDFWYGHVHFGVNYQYTASEISSKASGVTSLGSHIVSRCGGNWGGSGEVCRDGTPRGFVELDIDGTDSHWQFHSIDSNYDHTMNAYAPKRFAGESLTNYDEKALYCNVYMWDNLWGTPEVWTGGAKSGNMVRVIQNTDAAYDPLFQHTYPSVKERGLPFDDSPTNKDNMHLFKFTPADGSTTFEIRVTDRWGATHSINVK